MTENKIDMKTNNYLGKNINFHTPWPPKYDINLLNFFFLKFLIILFLQLKTICIMEIENEKNVNKKFKHYLSENSEFPTR